jgi:predicted GNAT family acetyltransferase
MKDGLDIRFEKTAKGGRYFIAMPNGELSRLTFVNAGEGHIIADHTFVPPPYRNQGVAEAMVVRLVADARARQLKITPTCWFVADEFARHRGEWDDVLAG